MFFDTLVCVKKNTENMEDKFLYEFLKTGLFDIGESDERLTWLKKAIVELQKKLEKDYSLLPEYTLVALDPNISDTEQTLIDTENIIIPHWETLRVRFTEMPRNIIRGVILNAINTIGMADPIAARIIYLTAHNVYPYAKLNSEKNLIDSMLNTFGEIAEKNAVEEWSLLEEEPSLKLGTLKVSNLKFEPVKLDKAKFQEKWEQAFTNEPNGHGPQHGFQNEQYRNHFKAKTNDAIVSSFNATLDGFNKSISTLDLDTPINKFFTEFKKTLDANLKTSFSSLTAVERRSKLLWWKETLYSPSQKKSYRGFDKHLLTIIMSADLNKQVPEITPISVDYLLRDTFFLLNDKQDKSIKFSDYLTEISKTENKSVLKSYFGNLIEREGRISITGFIALLVNDRISISNFKERTGIDANEQITFGELSVVVLHDFLTQRLITE